MGLITRAIPALWNGVSQQPPPVRDPSQCEEQVNCVSSIIDGVRKRPPSEHIAKITSDRLGTAYIHTINRDVYERYVVIVTEAGIRVFDMEGTEHTVTAPLGWGYLDLPADTNARGAYVCMTVADYTFVLNKTKVVELLDVGADHDPPSSDYWWLNRPRGSSPMPVSPVGEFGDGGGAVGHLPGNSNPITGGYSANPAGTLAGTVQTLTDLPTGATNGQVYKIIGNDESSFASYYVIKQSTGWYETVLPGLKNLVDATTMPHALIRQGDGTFIFGPFAWDPRHVGDDNTNPHPTFVGRAIRDIFFEKNRLGFCVDENVIMSRTGRYDVFYRLTVVDLLADEVIDIGASETKVTKIEFAVPMGSSMMLFSDQTQFKLSWSQALTGQTVSLDVATQYPAIPGVRPAPAGSDIYFPSDGSGWGLVREYYVAEDGTSTDASDITAHVRRYIPYGIHALLASPEFDSVYVLTDGAPNHVYAYKYYWQSDTEKAQSAWGHWEFSDDVALLCASCLGGYLYLIVDRSDGTYIERIAMFSEGHPVALPFQVHLDRRCEISGVYNSTTDRTTFTLPYSVSSAQRSSFACVRGSAFEGAKAAALAVTWVSTTQFTALGDQTAGDVVCGLKYTARYVFSKPYLRNAQNEAIHSGRLQIKTFTIYYTDTAYFRVEVRPFGAGSNKVYKREFPQRIVSIEEMSSVGEPVFPNGKAVFGVQANATEAEVAVVSDDYLGFCLASAEWEGFYFSRASR